MTLIVVILTKNEERHIARALGSVAAIADTCVVVDSRSTDRMVNMATAAGATVMKHAFITQVQKFNWAVDQLPDDAAWVLRLDADEIVTPALAAEIRDGLASLPPGHRVSMSPVVCTSWTVVSRGVASFLSAYCGPSPTDLLRQ